MFKFCLPLFLCLAGCVLPGQSTYLNDPLTGGVDSHTSTLLHIPLPAGLQYYPSHSSKKGGGRMEGLEILRGYIDNAAAADNFYSSLKQAGWSVRMREDAGSRSIHVYEKADSVCVILFQPQGMLTVVQIWLGPRLTDSSLPDLAPPVVEDSWPEASAPATPPQGSEERFGPQEREL